MQFVIKGMKYNTENMEEVAEVRKWYRVNNFFFSATCPGKEIGREYQCKLWKSEKGNWLLTHEGDYREVFGEAIQEEEAKKLLMNYATAIYETMYEKLPEA